MGKNSMTTDVNLPGGIAIFGGTGFIGRHLINCMSLKQNTLIRVFTRNTRMVSNFSNGNIKYIDGNLDSFDDIYNFVAGQKVVINLTYIDGDHEANLAFVSHLINACVAAGVERVLHLSTAVVAGRVAGDVIDEKTICNPITEYEKTKLCIEDKITSISLGKIGLIILRPTAIFGDGGVNLVKIVNSILHDSYLKNMMYVMTNKYRKMHLVHINTVVQSILYLSFIEKNISKEVFIVSSDNEACNNYFKVVQCLTKSLGVGQYPKLFLPFSEKIVKLILTLTGRSQINPCQIYSSQKIIQYGFKYSSNFIQELNEFALMNQK